MSLSRGLCAFALVCVAACSFPDYAVPDRLPPQPDCDNGVRDGAETQVDCGGDCRPCHCNDNVRSGDEEAVDCGGSCEACPACVNGRRDADEEGVDCGGSCPDCPTCSDDKQNGSESDVDCGGTCSKRCETDRRCLEADDCASLVCDRVCQPSNCKDGVRNGAETGPDCGGGCVGCGNGMACKDADDCLSARCVDEICVDARCTDGAKNGLETDVDCGGPACAPCMAPAKCELARDCASKVCGSDKRCTVASCEDEVQNQDETWPDCGGAVCDPCEVGEGCKVASDCATRVCLRGTCVPESPSNEELGRGGWVFSSSEPATESGAGNLFDGNDDSHWSSGAPQRSGMYVEVDLGKQTIFFKALLKEVTSPQNQDVPGYIDAYVSSDGNFGEPVRTRVQGNEWLWVDFQGPQVGRYLRFQITEPRQRSWSVGEIYVYR